MAVAVTSQYSLQCKCHSSQLQGTCAIFVWLICTFLQFDFPCNVNYRRVWIWNIFSPNRAATKHRVPLGSSQICFLCWIEELYRFTLSSLESCWLPLLQGVGIYGALEQSRQDFPCWNNRPFVRGSLFSLAKGASCATQGSKKLQNGILTGSWIALVIDSSPHIFYSSKSMNICQIKLIANVWLFSSCSIPCCRFVSGEAVCSIDLNLKNDSVYVVSFFFFPFFLSSSLY